MMHFVVAFASAALLYFAGRPIAKLIHEWKEAEREESHD